MKRLELILVTTWFSMLNQTGSLCIALSWLCRADGQGCGRKNGLLVGVAGKRSAQQPAVTSHCSPLCCPFWAKGHVVEKSSAPRVKIMSFNMLLLKFWSSNTSFMVCIVVVCIKRRLVLVESVYREKSWNRSSPAPCEWRTTCDYMKCNKPTGKGTCTLTPLQLEGCSCPRPQNVYK